MSTRRIWLSGGVFQFHESSMKPVKVPNNCLPSIQTFREGSLCKNLLQNRMGQAPNVCVLECFVVKASSACKHFKSSRVVLCCGHRCHLQLVKLCMCCMCSVWISKSHFDIFQEGLQSLYL